jgi:geranylgeranylglycerol-phosphate geranylgeranyltransferase
MRAVGQGGVVGLFRVGNCLMAALGALLAAVVCVGLDGLSEFALEVLLSMLVASLFTAAGNALNDYFDREVDKVAHPERPIPSGRVTPSTAFALSSLMFGAAFVLTLFVSLWSVTIFVIALVAMVGYERYLKAVGFAGNLAISWLTAALFLFGGAAVDKMDLAWILAALAFLATLGREIAKDVQDVEGDRASRRTLPMRIGIKNAGIAASASLIAAVALSPAPYLLDLLSIWYVPVVLAADAIFIYSALILMKNPEQGQKIVKLAMLVALLAFLLGGVL